jgi:hypothetical protein
MNPLKIMISYEGHSYTPTNKTAHGFETRATPLVVWTPTTSMRIGLTDLEVYQINTGSCRVRFGSRGGDPTAFHGSVRLMEFYLTGSNRVVFSFQTPILCPDLDLPLYVETSVSGGLYVTAQGFEQ